MSLDFINRSSGLIGCSSNHLSIVKLSDPISIEVCTFMQHNVHLHARTVLPLIRNNKSCWCQASDTTVINNGCIVSRWIANVESHKLYIFPLLVVFWFESFRMKPPSLHRYHAGLMSGNLNCHSDVIQLTRFVSRRTKIGATTRN